MPLFGGGAEKAAQQTAAQAELEMPVREALQLLENASLVMRLGDRTGGGHLVPTTLGLRALAEGTVGQYLPH